MYVTKQKTSDIEGSREPTREIIPGVFPFDVTPGMINAGLNVYLAFLPGDAPRAADQEQRMLRDVFLAMLSHRLEHAR